MRIPAIMTPIPVHREHLISQRITKSLFNSGVHDESTSAIIFRMDSPLS